VNAVCPGPVRTRLMAAAMRDPEVSAAYRERIPPGRIAEPDEVASAIAFLASDEASFITGVNLPVDGGLACWSGQPDVSGNLTR
jgi:meso-butanediol dehydrogenase/(S,S)-butanediol dehydrogenase/diacetyl reductase